MPWLALVGSLALLTGAQPPLVFPASAELVYVVVSVTDPSGQPVSGLTARELTVSEDGKRREIQTFASCADVVGQSAAECPVDMVLLLDMSNSMRDNLIRARDDAVSFAGAVPAARGRRIITFDSVLRRWPYDEANPGRVLDEILESGGGGATRFFDAVRDGIKQVTRDSSLRPVIVALTDGEDTGATTRPDFQDKLRDRRPGEDLLDIFQSESVSRVAGALQAEAVTFYAISFRKHLPTKDRSDHAAHVLGGLAKATGGLVANGDAEDLNIEFARIRKDLAAQYIIGFIPGTSAAGRSHKLKVQVAGKDLSVRHRLAYETKARVDP